MLNFLRKTSLFGKILMLGILITGLVYLYSLFVSNHISNTSHSNYLSYQKQRDSILQSLPQGDITLSGNTYETPIFLITPKEVNAVSINTNLSFDLQLSERVVKNKKYAIGYILYCYDPVTSKISNIDSIDQQIDRQIDMFCESKKIPSDREDVTIVQSLQKLSDVYLSYETTNYNIWHMFPFTRQVLSWKGGDYFGLGFILFITLGIWELLVFIYTKKELTLKTGKK